LADGTDSGRDKAWRRAVSLGRPNALDVCVGAAYLGLIKRIEVCGFARLAS